MCQCMIPFFFSFLLYQEAKDEREHETTDKAFNCLLGDNCMSGVLPQKESTDISKRVITDNKCSWHNKPNQAFENIINNKMCLEYDQKDGHMSPSEL